MPTRLWQNTKLLLAASVQVALGVASPSGQAASLALTDDVNTSSTVIANMLLLIVPETSIWSTVLRSYTRSECFDIKLPSKTCYFSSSAMFGSRASARAVFASMRTFRVASGKAVDLSAR